MTAPRLLTTRRMVRRGVVGSGSGSSATLVRVRRAALRKSGAPLRTHEHALAAVTSATLVGVSLLGLRFPRLLARRPALFSALFAWLGLVAPRCRCSPIARLFASRTIPSRVKVEALALVARGLKAKICCSRQPSRVHKRLSSPRCGLALGGAAAHVRKPDPRRCGPSTGTVTIGPGAPRRGTTRSALCSWYWVSLPCQGASSRGEELEYVQPIGDPSHVNRRCNG